MAMIAGIFHQGSGLGNQLHRYIGTRVLALDKGCDFGMIAPELFKGKEFMNLDMGVKNEAIWDIQQGTGKVFTWSGSWNKTSQPPMKTWNEWNKNIYDPDFNFVEDNTIIDGEFQDERYFISHLPEIREWLKVEPLTIPDDVCVINFRGGEYQGVPELFLPQSYWQEAIDTMKKLVPYPLRFEVHTDDPTLAARIFYSLPIYHDIGLNWRSIRHAKYLILSNSSFAILPSLVNEKAEVIIAPHYWNRYNVKRWDYPQNYYRQFWYI